MTFFTAVERSEVQSSVVASYCHRKPLAGQSIEYPLAGCDQSVVLCTDPLDLGVDVLWSLDTSAPRHVGNIVCHRVDLGQLFQGRLETNRQAMNSGKTQSQLGSWVFVDWIGFEQPENRVKVGSRHGAAGPQFVIRDSAGISDLVADAANQLDHTNSFCGRRKFRLLARDPRSPDRGQDCGDRTHGLEPGGPIDALTNNLDRNTHGPNAATILARAA